MDAALREALAAIVGPQHVLLDEAARRLASSDVHVWPDAVVADCVVQPGSTDELAQVVRALSGSATAIVPRGAGLSYTAGAVPHDAAVIIDTTRLDRITVHADDLHAVVGAGATWAALARALEPHGLRAAQISPISGSHSTVGGTASQNLPGGLDRIIGLTVVLIDGTVVRTGSSARQGTSAFERYAGPDLTGLFLGDCGAFGVKSEVVVRLAPEREATFASFRFETADAMLAALITLRRRELVTRALSMDDLKADLATRVDAAEAMRVAGAVVREAGSAGRALKDLAQLAMGRSAMKASGWSLHLTVEGATAAIAEAQMDLARAVCRAQGQAISDVVPRTLRARPYSVRGMVGPAGERWVPIHGILPLTRAAGCMSDLLETLEASGAELTTAGVLHTWLISTIGAYVTIEPMFYWNDRLDPIHMKYLSARNQARFGNRDLNQAARELVSRLRIELREVMERHGAVHAQLGRFYPWRPVLDPGSTSLLERVKDALDPGRRMNPGVLGLS
ncbi:MAG: FAD-binding oxidoreductase [Lautropia sp.]